MELLDTSGAYTKSYDFVREYVAETSQVDFVPHREELAVDYAEDSEIDVKYDRGTEQTCGAISPQGGGGEDQRTSAQRHNSPLSAPEYPL